MNGGFLCLPGGVLVERKQDVQEQQELEEALMGARLQAKTLLRTPNSTI